MKAMSFSVRRTEPVLVALVLAWAMAASACEASSLAVAKGPAADAAAPSVVQVSRTADFRGGAASDDARRVADWVVASADNVGSPFVIVDKIRAKVFVFDKDGRLLGSTLALLGRARGDDTVPGIGTRRLANIQPWERTTPAGRFVAQTGHDFHQDILWIDYENSISMHRVVKGDPGDNRLGRLATASPLDKRISYGCINVPVKFYDDVVLKAFTGARGVVYILPEIKAIEDVFPLVDVSAAHRGATR
jgi:hypothetical protein